MTPYTKSFIEKNIDDIEYLNYDVVIKEWVTVGDDKVREAHRKANGQRVKNHEKFIVGGEELLCPGDPNGSAENVINCRCYMRAGIVSKI